MDKKNILSLVLGLVVGGLVVWLLITFAGVGATMVSQYGGKGTLTPTPTPGLTPTPTTASADKVLLTAGAVLETADALTLPENDPTRQAFISGLPDLRQAYAAEDTNSLATFLCKLGHCKENYGAHGWVTSCTPGFLCNQGGGHCTLVGSGASAHCSGCVAPN